MCGTRKSEDKNDSNLVFNGVISINSENMKAVMVAMWLRTRERFEKT